MPRGKNINLFLMRVNRHIMHDDTSILELNTPIQSYKYTNGQEAYEQTK